MQKVLDNKKEIKFASVVLGLTIFLLSGLFFSIASGAYEALMAGDTRAVADAAVFGGAMFFVAYGNLLYQICLIGHYKRRDEHKPIAREELERVYLKEKAPALTTLVPSYKEERTVNWQTMMSAALAEYPSKNVVLLIDDPYQPKALPDMVKLDDTRLIPGEMQALFDAPAAHYREMQAQMRARAARGQLRWEEELVAIAEHYENVAHWLDGIARDFMKGQSLASMYFADRFFVEAILGAPAAAHRNRAAELRGQVSEAKVASMDVIEMHYARLVGLHTIRFSSFERKRYSNLSHEANKAMNLNSYMALVGKSWKEVDAPDGLHICEATPEHADFTIAPADYINTIDSDSLMLSEYALRLIHIMEDKGNEKLAVIQSPCSAFPGCPGGVERAAGACIDVQFLTHQGYTYWGASFWVGANAMLRHRALEEIKEIREENGYPISIYIQDRTVIEDTESTIDLVHKGWRLYNYPERMTFSANPPDFGSLLIQRRRWSNGGLIILPKLIRYAMKSPKNLALAKEIFMRFHYLASTTTGCVAAFIFMFYPFTDLKGTEWLMASIVPFFALYIRDVKNSGYRASDVFRICAMTLMLFPIVTGGVLKSFQQILTGKKIPFGRTPKITGRTAAPALYSLIALITPFAFASVVVSEMMGGQLSKALFACVNVVFSVYALVYFIGVKEAFEDVTAGITSRLRRSFHKAEIIPLHTTPPSAPMPQLASKQA